MARSFMASPGLEVSMGMASARVRRPMPACRAASPQVRKSKPDFAGTLRAGPLTTLQASLHAADQLSCSLKRALDTGLRPGPFPTRAASLLPGLLTATRTGLTSASDDEHEPTDHPVTRSPPVPLGARTIEANVASW